MLVHHEAVGLTTALLGDVLVLHYRRTPTEQTVVEVERQVKAAVAERERIAILVIIAADQPVPDAGTRSGITQLLERYTSNAIAIAQVPRGSGFMAAAVRAVLTSMSLIVRPPYPMRVFARHDEAIQWLAKRGARLVGAPAMVAAALG